MTDKKKMVISRHTLSGPILGFRLITNRVSVLDYGLTYVDPDDPNFTTGLYKYFTTHDCNTFDEHAISDIPDVIELNNTPLCCVRMLVFGSDMKLVDRQDYSEPSISNLSHILKLGQPLNASQAPFVEDPEPCASGMEMCVTGKCFGQGLFGQPINFSVVFDNLFPGDYIVAFEVAKYRMPTIPNIGDTFRDIYRFEFDGII